MKSALYRFFAAAAVTLFAVTGLQAQEAWPEREVRFIVGFPAGGTPDIFIRKLQPLLAESLGSSVIVENRPGASGVTAAAGVIQAEDEHTFGVVVSSHVSLAALNRSLPYDPLTDFRPVVLLGRSSLGMFVRTGLDVSNFGEFVEFAKANPAAIKYVLPGIGVSHQFLTEQIKINAGIDIAAIAYSGNAPGLVDILGNQIDAIFLNVPTALSYVEANQIKPIVIAAPQRAPQIPDMETFAEAGYPGIDRAEWFGIVAPGSASDEVVEKLNAALATALASAEIQEWMAANNIEGTISDPDEFGAFMADQYDVLKQIAVEANITE